MNRPNDEPSTAITPHPASGPGASARSRGMRFKLAALALTLISALAGTGLAYWLKPAAPAIEPPKPEPKYGIPARLFPNWGKPDFVLILSAQQHGYMLPCGCSSPQVGGLERRYNFMQLLKARGWTPVAVDLGDVPQRTGPVKLPNVQGLLKYQYSMKALERMGYLGVGVGEFEAAYSLARIEGEWAANNDTPAVLAGNLHEPENTFPLLKTMAVQTVPGCGVKVGATNIIGPTVAERIKDPTVKFERTDKSLNQLLKNMQAAKVDLPILLYHGSATPREDGVKEAIACAEKYPQFPVIVCLSEEDEPPGRPEIVNDPKSGTRNYVFRLGHKGKNIGVLGVYRNGPGNSAFAFKYQLVEMGEEYMTPKEQEGDHPIQKLMEDYTRELKDKNYLARYGQSKHILQALPPVAGLRNPGDGVPTYIGSEACGKCHVSAYEVWEKSDHSHAYKTLVKAHHPSLRQYDGECIVCHTVGFGYNGGFTDDKKTAKLKNVGCESCHGPGSLHAKNPKDREWQQRMNQPWRGAKDANAKTRAIDNFCMTCHDTDNDVTWIHNAFPKKWQKIIHTKD
ncbi:MAG TPA: multiheme c-type cytochrome [Gemmataceae bacterium]|jgi:hypothetical protein